MCYTNKLPCLALHIFHKFHDLHIHVMSPVLQASLEYRKAYIQHIEILHYIDFVKKKDDLITVV